MQKHPPDKLSWKHRAVPSPKQVNSKYCSSSLSSAPMGELLLLVIRMCTWPISYTNKNTVNGNVNTGTSTIKGVSQQLC